MAWISSKRRKAIQREAEKLLLTLFEKREEFWAGSPPSDALDLIDLRIIITKYLGARYSEPEEIAPHPGHSHIAGYLDRDANEIAIAQRLKPEIRRFTAAHEIGHWVLHPGTTYFRDAPVDGNDRDQERPIEEREADLFASTLLMPSKLARKEFRRHFGTESLATVPVDHLAYLLNHGQSKKVKPSELLTTRQVSTLAAKCLPVWSSGYPSLAEVFRVSPAAMAIRLEELELVPFLDDPRAPVEIPTTPVIWLYDTFICYRQEDKNLVREIVKQLKDRGLNPWSDESLIPGMPWMISIQEAIKGSRTAAIFLGSQGFDGFQVKEVAYLEKLKRTLIPVFLPGWEGDLPLPLADCQAVDLRKDDPEALEKLIQGISNSLKATNSN